MNRPVPAWKNKIETFRFSEAGGIPNNPELPVLLLRRAFDPSEGDLAEALERRFSENGWIGMWRWGVFDHHHYHSNAHEVLGVAAGEARLTLGGPGGETLDVRAGDLLVLPAGTGHKNEGASIDFEVVGAYPAGQDDYDLNEDGEAVTDAIRESIAATPRPATDPLFGSEGPVTELWARGDA